MPDRCLIRSRRCARTARTPRFGITTSEGNTALAGNEGAARPLDDVPGLGLSRDAVLRDEAISYWEAWKRDVAVQDCMRGQDFDWEPEVAYPSEAVLDVAGFLAVTPSPGAGGAEAAVARNGRRVSELTAEERDRYFQALVGGF
jgi:hypothetical protein